MYRERLANLLQAGADILRGQGNYGDEETDQIVGKLAQVIEENEDDGETVQVSKLTLSQVKAIFKIKPSQSQAETWYLCDDVVVEEDEFAHMAKCLEDLALAFEYSTLNEEAARTRLNLIFGCLLAYVKRQNLPESSAMSMQVETSMKIKMRFSWKSRLRARFVGGRIDYGLWYRNKEQLDTNLVVMEAKRPEELSKAEPQLLGYMGMVRKARKRMKKPNLEVYGIATDSFIFHFYHLSQEGEWTKHTLSMGNTIPSQRPAIFALLIKIMTDASLLSPNHSQRSSRLVLVKSSMEIQHGKRNGDTMDESQ